MRSLILGAVCGVLAAQTAPLAYPELEARLRPSPEILKTEAHLADQARELNATRGFLREGPTLSVETGPRKAVDLGGRSLGSDRAVELDLPLFLDASARRAMTRVLGEASPLLRQVARVETRYRLRLAYLDAWLEAEVARLRREDVQTLETWLQAARARVEAGADPAFQASLAEGEVLKALQERDEATHRARAAWGRLGELADLPAHPLPLAAPGAPQLGDTPALQARFEAGLALKVLEARGRLEQGRLRLEASQALSRWSLRGAWAREGDEQVARLGLAVRLPRPGEARTVQAAREARSRVLERDLDTERRDLQTRMACALERLESARDSALPPEANLVAALKAVELRLLEGRDRPSDALPVRRQLLEARIALARRLHALHALQAELEAYTTGVNP